MELMAVIIMAFVGWGHGLLGLRELKGLALVAFGWTLVITVAGLPGLALDAVLTGFAVRFAVVGGAYAAGVGVKRLVQRQSR